MIPRLGESVRPSQSYRLRPGAYALLVQGDKVLLTFQAEPEPEFQLPGGGIDPGEPPVRALYREVYEETGWSITAPRRVGAFRRFTYMAEYDLWAEKICHIYVARPTVRRSDPVEPGHTALWMPARDVPSILGNEGDRYFAARLLG